jgi:hypothetical protein
MLFEQYVLMPRDKLTRGRLESMLAPISRINKALQELPGKDLMQAKLAEWRKRVNDIYALPENSPQFRTQLKILWSEDQYLLLITNPTSDDDVIPPEITRKIESFLVLSATSEALEKNLNYLLSLYWAEKAARSQHDHSKLKGDVAKGMADQVESQWLNAYKWMEKYLNAYGLAPSSESWAAHLHTVHQRIDQGAADPSLLDEFFTDLHKGLYLRLLQSEALRRTGKTTEARASAQQLADDVQALRDNAELKNLLAKFEAKFKKTNDEGERKEYLAVLERWSGTLGAHGSVAWIGHTAALRAKE